MSSPDNSLRNRAYELLQEWIVTQVLQPNTTVTEEELAERSGIGRTPIREALQRLAREGLLTIRPRSAIVVLEMTPARQLQLLEARASLQEQTVRLAARRADAEERARMLLLASAVEDAGRIGDGELYLRITRDIPRWIAVSIPMFVIDSIYVVLMYVDVLILKQYRSPEEIAVYYAAAKTMALVSFVYFAVAAASAHKFSEYFEAGDRPRLASFVRDAIHWTFWPSVAACALVLALGWPLLWLFGERFVTGYHLMFVLAIGILARAAIGPGERFLAMLGEQKSCAAAALVALAVNLVLCFTLIPGHGVMGAAIATSCAFIVESVLIFVIARRRLGFHLFVLGGRQ